VKVLLDELDDINRYGAVRMSTSTYHGVDIYFDHGIWEGVHVCPERMSVALKDGPQV